MPKPVDSGRHQLPRVMARIAITMGETKSMMQYVPIHSTKYRQTHACKTNIPNKYNIDDQRSFVRRQSTIDDRISPLIQTHCLVLGSMLQATYANFGGVSKMGSVTSTCPAQAKIQQISQMYRSRSRRLCPSKTGLSRRGTSMCLKDVSNCSALLQLRLVALAAPISLKFGPVHF